MSNGTPKTLFEAIFNGIYEKSDDTQLSVDVEKHVRDFIAQKFGTARMKADDVTDAALVALFNQITGEKIS